MLDPTDTVSYDQAIAMARRAVKASRTYSIPRQDQIQIALMTWIRYRHTLYGWALYRKMRWDIIDAARKLDMRGREWFRPVEYNEQRDAPIDRGFVDPLIDRIDAERMAAKIVRWSEAWRPRDRDYITGILEGLTHTQIAERWGVTQSAVAHVAKQVRELVANYVEADAQHQCASASTVRQRH